MTKFRNLLFLLSVCFIFGCNSTQQHSTETEPTASETEPESKLSYFGAKISADDALPFDQLLQTMHGTDSLAVKVKGKVEDVCQAKGCWMNIVSNEPGQAPMMVRFKDYGFFVPKDIGGKEVIIDGYAFRETTSVDELRHYAEDAGKSKAEIEAINEPKEELKFLASGVILLDE